MIGLVLVTHGNLANELVIAMEHIAGPQEQIGTICVGPKDDMDVRRLDISNAIKACDDGSGVIVLTDLFGGTPSNLSINLMNSNKIEVISGVNIPMLISLSLTRSKMNIKQLSISAIEAGRKYTTTASEYLSDSHHLFGGGGEFWKKDIKTVDRYLYEFDQSVEILQEFLSNTQNYSVNIVGIGHNGPPIEMKVNISTVYDGVAARQIFRDEIDRAEPRKEVISLCLKLLKKLLKIVKKITQYILSKADVFIDGTLESSSKAVGPVIVASAAISQLGPQLTKIVEFLEGLLETL